MNCSALKWLKANMFNEVASGFAAGTIKKTMLTGKPSLIANGGYKYPVVLTLLTREGLYVVDNRHNLKVNTLSEKAGKLWYEKRLLTGK